MCFSYKIMDFPTQKDFRLMPKGLVCFLTPWQIWNSYFLPGAFLAFHQYWSNKACPNFDTLFLKNIVLDINGYKSSLPAVQRHSHADCAKKELFCHWQITEDICKFCFLDCIAKYPPHPALFLFCALSIIKYPVIISVSCCKWFIAWVNCPNESNGISCLSN